MTHRSSSPTPCTRRCRCKTQPPLQQTVCAQQTICAARPPTCISCSSVTVWRAPEQPAARKHETRDSGQAGRRSVGRRSVEAVGNAGLARHGTSGPRKQAALLLSIGMQPNSSTHRWGGPERWRLRWQMDSQEGAACEVPATCVCDSNQNPEGPLQARAEQARHQRSVGVHDRQPATFYGQSHLRWG